MPSSEQGNALRGLQRGRYASAHVLDLPGGLSLHWVGLATRVSCSCRVRVELLLSGVPLVPGGGEVVRFLWPEPSLPGQECPGELTQEPRMDSHPTR